jgi:hypothetical protein
LHTGISRVSGEGKRNKEARDWIGSVDVQFVNGVATRTEVEAHVV